MKGLNFLRLHNFSSMEVYGNFAPKMQFQIAVSSHTAIFFERKYLVWQ